LEGFGRFFWNHGQASKPPKGARFLFVFSFLAPKKQGPPFCIGLHVFGPPPHPFGPGGKRNREKTRRMCFGRRAAVAQPAGKIQGGCRLGKKTPGRGKKGGNEFRHFFCVDQGGAAGKVCRSGNIARGGRLGGFWFGGGVRGPPAPKPQQTGGDFRGQKNPMGSGKRGFDGGETHTKKKGLCPGGPVFFRRRWRKKIFPLKWDLGFWVCPGWGFRRGAFLGRVGRGRGVVGAKKRAGGGRRRGGGGAPGNGQPGFCWGPAHLLDLPGSQWKGGGPKNKKRGAPRGGGTPGIFLSGGVGRPGGNQKNFPRGGFPAPPRFPAGGPGQTLYRGIKLGGDPGGGKQF